MRKLVVAVFAFTLAGSALAQPAKPTTDPTVAKLAGEFVAAFNAKDAARVTALYAEDAVLMPTGRPAVRGKANIENHFKQAFAAGLTGMALSPLDQKVTGDLAYDVGHYSLSVPTPTGQPATVKGKYLVLLKKVGGQWKVAYDMDNPDAGPPPAQ